LGLLVEAHNTLGSACFWRGEFAAARAHLQQSVALYDPQQHRTQPICHGSDPKVACLATLALTLWVLGYPEQALARLHTALTLAQELAHPFSLAHVLNYAAGLHLVRREPALTQTQAEATLALSMEQGFPHWQAGGAILRGWALAEHGQSAEGITQMRQSIAVLRAMGAEVMCPWYLGMLAETYGKAGQPGAGLDVLAEALHMVDQHGERVGAAELSRLHGELLLLQDALNEPQAEACFQEALAIARHQQAKSWELRAAMSLARLRQRQGQHAEARRLLAEVYAWFSEGFDTADLQEARALLEACS
jgi:predicted ATPase